MDAKIAYRELLADMKHEARIRRLVAAAHSPVARRKRAASLRVLSPEAAAEIKVRAAKETRKSLAAYYNVTVSTIYNVLKGKYGY